MIRLARPALAALAAVVLVTAAAGCGDPSAPGAPSTSGERGAGWSTLRVALSGGDVAGVRYDVACEGGSSFASFVPREEEGLPPATDAEHAGRPFTDLFVLAPTGRCVVSARAMASETEPLPDCAPATATVSVVPGETVEVVLVISCAVPA